MNLSFEIIRINLQMMNQYFRCLRLQTRKKKYDFKFKQFSLPFHIYRNSYKRENTTKKSTKRNRSIFGRRKEIFSNAKRPIWEQNHIFRAKQRRNTEQMQTMQLYRIVHPINSQRAWKSNSCSIYCSTIHRSITHRDNTCTTSLADTHIQTQCLYAHSVYTNSHINTLYTGTGTGTRSSYSASFILKNLRNHIIAYASECVVYNTRVGPTTSANTQHDERTNRIHQKRVRSFVCCIRRKSHGEWDGMGKAEERMREKNKEDGNKHKIIIIKSFPSHIRRLESKIAL